MLQLYISKKTTAFKMSTILATGHQTAVTDTTATSTTNIFVDSFREINEKTTCMHKLLLCIIYSHLGRYNAVQIMVFVEVFNDRFLTVL